MVGRVGDWSPPSLSRSAGACGWRRYPQKEIRSKPVSSKELKENPQPKAMSPQVDPRSARRFLAPGHHPSFLARSLTSKKSPSCLPSCTWLRWRRCLRRTLTLLQSCQIWIPAFHKWLESQCLQEFCLS
ncbi:uncharacterized protein LOC130683873 isoform X4 [Manis pentadactyla]|uniref:uncharacterized protein LOC130683873 isoform X4 n=1 Tax=Manis pentadactyla TaxID=143292 RepID=UPI00255C5D09|nr:uncharacterized protein LOC130683873 isoform X4 [Manis pentadactyla]